TNIFEKIVNNLNVDQIAVVEREDNLYVIACPGSGQTRVLTRKIAYQAIKHDGSLKRIIAITYTTRAAEQIKERLRLLR
ncbi:UvrD-helicase domain-containing protein, partial [Staphylococcus aureus]|uniref:UvrD-helicase domain-containing protein n=1 Tax=Staphylococcus aureus TaxID=1280 RepID=UPI001022A6C0